MLRRLLFVSLLFLFAPLTFAFEVPSYDGYLTDQANLFTDENSIEEALSALALETDFEFAVLTMPEIDTTIEDAATTVFNEWGIGDKDKDTGLLFMVTLSDYSGNRQMRLETGYGVESIITDLEADWLLDDIVPYFQSGSFDEGMLHMISQVRDEFEGETNMEDTLPLEALETYTSSPSSGGGWFIMAVYYFLALFFTGFASFMARSKEIWPGAVVGGIGGLLAMFMYQASWIVIPIMAFVGLVIDLIISPGSGGGGGGSSSGGSSSRSYRSSSSSSWSSSSSSSSSFGGFSGGSSGGGGSSKSW